MLPELPEGLLIGAAGKRGRGLEAGGASELMGLTLELFLEAGELFLEGSTCLRLLTGVVGGLVWSKCLSLRD